MPIEQEVERCEYMYVHQDVVNKVKQDMPQDETLYDLAELFKVFGDSTRIKILYALFEAELCGMRYRAAFKRIPNGSFTSAACA